MEEMIAQARQILPWWIVWVNALLYLLTAGLATVLASLTGALFMSLGRRGADGDNWMERARLDYPARLVLGTSRIILLALFLAGTLALAWPFSELARIIVAFLTCAVVLLASIWVLALLERRMFKSSLPMMQIVQGQVCFHLCFHPHALLIFVVAFALPPRWDGWCGILAACIVILYVFLILGGGLLIARVIGLAKPASPRLVSIVNRASQTVDVHPRRVYEVTWASANAVAFPIIGGLAFTEQAMAKLSDDELEAICLHELGHLAEPRIVLAVRAITLLAFLPFAFFHPIVATFGYEIFFVIVVVAFLIALLFRRVARKMEVRADQYATETESSKGTYARALYRLYEVNRAPMVIGSKRAAHPDLYDRLISAGVEPEFDRPQPPSRLAGFVGVVCTLSIAVFVYLAWCLRFRRRRA